ncbi:MAG: PRC-barrel domain-containing protein [Peptococcaceae bacterium]|nr:PRC-barrel domain-containing protein [Peptococcaceae bacterium]
MKSSQQILGLPVLSIEEGKKIGEVKHLVLNPQRGTLDYLLVEDGAWYLGPKALPFSAVQGIGEFALTIAGRSSLSGISELSGAVDLLEKDLRLPGLKVLSKKGRLVGSISEYFINEDTGEIAGCQLVPVNGETPAGIIPRKLILTYGRDFLVVEEGVEDRLLEELPEAGTAAEGRGGAAKSPAAADTLPQSPAGEKQTGEALKHFEEEQRKYILGKKVAIRIVADNGEVVAEEGEVITDETIERARAADRYIQLTLNVRD